MISQRALGIRSLALFWQLVFVTLCYWGWLLIWQPALFSERDTLQRYLLYNEFLLIGVLFGWGRRSDSIGLHHEWVVANRQTLRQAFLGLFSVFLILFALRDTVVSRSFLFSYLPWLYLSLFFCNYLLPRSLGKWAFSGDREERVALAGTVQQATQLRPWLERKELVGLRTVGLICPEPCGGVSAPFPVLGTTDRLREILRERSITQVILLDLSRGAAWVQNVTQLCEGAAVRLLALHDLNNYFNHSTTTFEDDGVRFIGLREEPLESPLNRFLKRVLDLLIAIPVVILLLPITTALAWLVQRFQSPGPIFYRQERTGMMGRPFVMLKYRTMHTNHNSEARQACKNDPRVFPAGRWMRKFSADELPQFLNVIFGDMSVVGPRPHLPEHEEIFVKAMQKYLIRKFIRPGITGWAQVKGFRGEIHRERDIHERVESDIYYLEHWSFSLDCLIILKTIKQCLAPPGTAY
jgi:putative colanic acid biosynthesis UDP-glucose lipid carrier transferase